MCIRDRTTPVLLMFLVSPSVPQLVSTKNMFLLFFFMSDNCTNFENHILFLLSVVVVESVILVTLFVLLTVLFVLFKVEPDVLATVVLNSKVVLVGRFVLILLIPSLVKRLSERWEDFSISK